MRLGISKQGATIALVAALGTMTSVLLLASTIPWSAANAGFAGVNGKITFMSTRDGNAEVYVLRLR